MSKPSHLPAFLSSIPLTLSSSKSTPLSSRRPPCARSLESYREGQRFSNQPPNQPKKKRLSLIQALTRLNVASIETCGLLVRSGCVRVNGNVVRDGKEKIDRQFDVLSVNGREVGSVDGEAEWEEERQTLPGTKKDLWRGDWGMSVEKKYTRKVDGGFYSSRRFDAGK